MSKELFPLESFIHGSYIDPKICDALMEEHKNSKDKKPGVLKNKCSTLCRLCNCIRKSIT